MGNSLRKIIILILIVVSFSAGWWSFRYYHAYRQASAEIQQVRHQEGYKFINPLYECEINGEEYLKKYIPFEDVIKERILNEVQEGKDMDVAVYFRNLNNGPAFGINQEDDFAPASLLKVPLMIAYFKKAEADPAVLQQKIIFNPNSDDHLEQMQQIIPGNHLEHGITYTVEELIDNMIIYSDNEAMAALMRNFNQNELYQIYADLGIANPYEQDKSNVISVKDYASFFRILYNAGYLNKTNSEKALALLAQTTFNGGIVAGVPAGISVAHKFGERELAQSDQDKYKEQFHDCGIVYYEKYPYLLCIMTRGNDKNALIETVKNVSRITFEEISKDYN